jgi:hypothetical protein
MNNEEFKESQIETINDVIIDEIPVAVCIEREGIPFDISHNAAVNAINIESFSYYNYNHPSELSNSENRTIINIDTPFPSASSRSDSLPIYISQESSNTNHTSFVKIRHIICSIIAFATILIFIFSFHP